MTLISHETAHVIFCNLDYKIIRIHRIILSQLEERLANWFPHQQIGNVFLEMVLNKFVTFVFKFFRWKNFQVIQIMSEIIIMLCK
jgi:hypothetical protein